MPRAMSRCLAALTSRNPSELIQALTRLAESSAPDGHNRVFIASPHADLVTYIRGIRKSGSQGWRRVCSVCSRGSDRSAAAVVGASLFQ